LVEWEEGRRVGVVGERVGVAVAKKEVVGEGFVDVVVEVVVSALVVEAEWEELEAVPEEMICWLVGHTKIGRPIVSFARVSIFPLVCCLLKVT
jgi:hypothetical protein